MVLRKQVGFFSLNQYPTTSARLRPAFYCVRCAEALNLNTRAQLGTQVSTCGSCSEGYTNSWNPNIRPLSSSCAIILPLAEAVLL